MKKIKYYFLTFTIGILISCNSSKKITKSKSENHYGKQVTKITEYIINDSTFVNDLKNYFPDLKTVDNLVFEPSTTIEFIPSNKFPQITLKKTEFFNNYKNLDFLKFERIVKKQDSLNKFSSYELKNLKTERKHLKNGDKKIYLKFSRKINNLVNIEYIIIDKNIDPRILYNPRNGYYLVEFNNQNEIVRRFYILRTIN